MTHTSGPSKPKTINSALRHQHRYVIQFIIIIILITTFHSVRVTNKTQSVSNAAYNFPGTYCSYSATGIRNWATQQTWLDCFFGFVSLAVQRLPKFSIPTFPVSRFPVPRFLLPRAISVPLTLNIAFISASRNSLRLWNCAQHAYSQLTFRRQSGALSEITGKVADPCKTRKKTPVQRVRYVSALSSGLTPPTPPPPVIRPPNAAADHQFVGAQL